MKIALNILPLSGGHFLKHRVRGTGVYTKNLQESLKTYFTDNNYLFFNTINEISKDIDVIHYPYFEPFFLTLPWRNLSKTVVTVHDLTPLVFPDFFPIGIRGYLKWIIQKNILKKISYIITDSENSKKDIIKYTNISSNKIGVVYLAASEKFKKINLSSEKIKKIIDKYGLPNKFILYVGDVTWNKNLPRLLKASIDAGLPLVMVGNALTDEIDLSNPWNKDLSIIRNIIEDNKKSIFPLGFVSVEDLVDLYNLARVFVMPSLYEGFGLPIIEAMSCGCPVIATRGGSIAEIVEDSAYFVDAYSVKSISDGIRKVFDSDIIRENLIKKGLNQVKKFSWQKTAEDTIKAYKIVIQNK
ncbi:glycosyl transferase [Candidatus Levyibacteriota bacterium]|nr:glycosyl transferase [Candidatus Levybacteria bacterium]